MNRLITFTISLSFLFSSAIGFANQQDNFGLDSFHTHEEVDHHTHDDHHHHGHDSAHGEEEVIAAPFVEDEQEEHTHEHQHDPNSPPHQHSHSHGHSHGNAPTSSIAWLPTNLPKLSGVPQDSKHIKPTEENRPEDPYLSSIFRPPIFA